MTTNRAGTPLGWLVLGARIIVAGLFIFAGYIKLSDPQQFAFSVNAFKLLPNTSWSSTPSFCHGWS